ncbi:MAG: transketolase, partial [Ignavibacteria bacterium]|nr:transketolase [Ignavibacteria bacterium]
RMEWEKEFDCLTRMRAWMLEEKLATEKEIVDVEEKSAARVRKLKGAAWDAYTAPIRTELKTAVELYSVLRDEIVLLNLPEVAESVAVEWNELVSIREPFRRDIMVSTHKVLQLTASANCSSRNALQQWRKSFNGDVKELYVSHLYSEGKNQIANVHHVNASYDSDSQSVNGSEIINAFFHSAFAKHNNLVMFGEDTGKLGDVNQGAVGLQEKFGEVRVSDVGIRECTILGQAIGLAMRGIRPIAEIQYLDYLLYSLQIMSDDLATVQWRTKGGQKAPVIVRTRGHRLEGVWHSGSPMAAIINLVRGMYVCVPRNFVQAAGMYNTLLQADEPGLVVEVLNGYRLKEKLPSNIGEYTVELGIPEVVRNGSHLTIVTYGATVKVVLDAATMLAKFGIECEVVDVQTLLPFDVHAVIAESLKKTSRLLIVDEDMPGGTSAYILDKIVEEQKAYNLLDSPPRTLTAAQNRPAYGTDGNYWSKPEAEHVFDAVQSIMNESNPDLFPITI